MVRVPLALVESPEGIEQVEPGGVVRIDVRRPLEMFHRLGQLALLKERDAQVVIGADIVRLDAQGLSVVFDRLG